MGSTNEINLQQLIDVNSAKLRVRDKANLKILDIRERSKAESLANEDRTLIIELRRQLVILQAKNARERRLRLAQKQPAPEPEREVGRVITDDSEASNLGSAILAARALTKLDGAIAAVYSLQGERDGLVRECASEYGVDVSKILEDEQYVSLGDELLARIRNCETSIKVLAEANACKENAALMFDLIRSCTDDVELMSMAYKTRHGIIMGLIKHKCKLLANKDVPDRALSSRAITSHADPMNANTRVAGRTVYSAARVVWTGLACATDTLVHSGLIIAGVIPVLTPPKAEVVGPTINITMTQNIYNTLYNSLYNTILTGGDSQISSGDAAMIASAARQGSMNKDAFIKYTGGLEDSEKAKAEALQQVTNDFASLNIKKEIKEEGGDIKKEIKVEDEDEEDEKQRILADSANAVVTKGGYNFRPRPVKTPP